MLHKWLRVISSPPRATFGFLIDGSLWCHYFSEVAPAVSKQASKGLVTEVGHSGGHIAMAKSHKIKVLEGARDTWLTEEDLVGLPQNFKTKAHRALFTMHIQKVRHVFHRAAVGSSSPAVDDAFRCVATRRSQLKATAAAANTSAGGLMLIM